MPLNRQEVFNIVSRHLLTQGEKSSVTTHDGTEVCQYRTPTGAMCSIGCLMPDRVYKHTIDSATDPVNVETLWWDYQEFRNLFAGDVTMDFLIQLQWLHDNVYPSDWMKFLDMFAIQEGLSLPSDIASKL